MAMVIIGASAKFQPTHLLEYELSINKNKNEKKEHCTGFSLDFVTYAEQRSKNNNNKYVVHILNKNNNT